MTEKYTPDNSKTQSIMGSILGVRFPEGVERHPRVLDYILDNLGHDCVIEAEDEMLRIGYFMKSQTVEAAKEESVQVAAQFISLLGLTKDSIVEYLNFRREPRTEQEIVGLSLVSPPEQQAKPVPQVIANILQFPSA